MLDRLFDYLAARPKALAFMLCMLLSMLCGLAFGWYFISPDSPYNQAGVPLMERAIYSEHLHH